jgi:tryptophan halogenase
MNTRTHAADDVGQAIRRVVILGGGTSGWMTAAALAKVLRGRWAIELVESEEIGTVGVGEATIPMIRLYNSVLEIDEDEFIRETQATFKLGIEFVNWGRLGDRYIHGFGKFGRELLTVPFHHYWLKMFQAGQVGDLERFSINRMACRAGKFMRADTSLGDSPLAEIVHAFHFDASLYARYLRRYAEARGVQRSEGKVARVEQRPDGDIAALVLESGRRVEGDLFIDCSGFRGLLIEQTLATGYEDWSQWLPVNRAWAVPCSHGGDFTPYTRATARRSGWQWRIPLQHRIGNGHVYCSDFISDDEARAELLAQLDGQPLAEPRQLRFVTGKRRLAWNRNVIAVGLAGGFLEPLESTSIHLVQVAIDKIVAFFPDRGFAQADVDEFNAQMDFEFERIRDFIILHYKLTTRDDTAFWRRCRDMAVPPSLSRRMALYREHGRIFRENNELFSEVAWLQVMHGQGLVPHSYHPLVDIQPQAATLAYLQSIESVIERCVEVMPSHAEFIAKHCRAAPLPA